MLILIADAFDASLPGRLRAFGEVTDDTTRLSEATVVLVRSKTKCTKEYIDKAKQVKLIIRGGVGLDSIDVDYAVSKGITVLNTPEASSVAVAELAVCLMLAAANQVIPGHVGMTQGKWLKKDLTRTELYQKTLGLVGMGRIAREVAKRAAAFGMNVIAYDAYVKTCDVASLMSFNEVIARADYLSFHLPLTDETKNMINADTIARMKKGVIVVNTARAEVVDEAAMAKALQNGHVGCYATDVWTSDPPPESCPLLKAPRVIMAPHMGASSEENLLRIGDLVVHHIETFVRAH